MVTTWILFTNNMVVIPSFCNLQSHNKKTIIFNKIVSNVVKFNVNFHVIQSIQIVAHYKHFKI